MFSMIIIANLFVNMCLFGGCEPPPLFLELPAPSIFSLALPSGRYALFNHTVLLSDDRNVGYAPEFAVNLFEDVNYIGVIDSFEITAPDNYTWAGHLKGVEYSYMFIIYVEGVYIAHFASPEGVYEASCIASPGVYEASCIASPEGVSWHSGDIYQIIEVIQPESGE